MKKYLRVLMCVLLLVVVFWGVWVASCEILTLRYGDEFADGYKLTGMLPEPDFTKVLKYNETEARVYYVKKYEVGSTVDFIKENDEWKLESWGDKAWSSDGSAESAVFPYFWHPVTMR